MRLCVRTGIPVCVFAKLPLLGRVKTRLARSIGAAAAAQLAAAMLNDVWSVAASLQATVPVLAAAEAGDFGINVPEERVWLQTAGDLGLRIECILRRALETAPFAIAVGADAPLITAAHLVQAIRHLRSGHAVLGPCCDGGFYLLGLSRCPPGLLAGIRWSSEHTFQETEHRLCAHGMTVAQLDALFDVDTVTEVEQLRSKLQDLPPEIAPRTRKWLGETG
jgi:rSAM/selenodomain-associated transferase 1